MTTELEEIKRQIKSGDLEAARRLLDSFTSADPLNTNAWVLLASISEDPNERAECYRHILQIDPGNRPIAAKLLDISSQILEASPQEMPAEGYDPFLYCRQCGGPAEVHFVGKMQDKRAICSYCGIEVDLPESYHRIQNLRGHSRLRGGDDRTAKGTMMANHHDGLPEPGDFDSYPPELQKIIQILTEKESAAPNEDHIIKLGESGINLSFKPEKSDLKIVQEVQDQGNEFSEVLPGSQLTGTTITTPSEKTGSFFKRPIFKRRKPKRKPYPLSLEERILLSGDPLPLDERQNCHNPRCGAVIPKSASECPWCGQSL